MLVYLAGPITADPRHLNWRFEITSKLGDVGVSCYNPVSDLPVHSWSSDGNTVLASDSPAANGGFVPRDLYNLRRSDAALFNYPCGPNRQSIGTWVEFGIAYSLGIPTVVCSTVEEVTKHPFIEKLCTKIVKTLEEAVEFVLFLKGDL